MSGKHHSLKSVALILSATLFCFFSCAKNGTTPEKPIETLPVITAIDAKETRTDKDAAIRFYFELNKTSSSTVAFNYNTVNGSAISGQDYLSASGKITFLPNQTQAYVDVVIKGDPTYLREPNKTFTMELSSPQGCILPKDKASGTILTENGTYFPTDNTGYTSTTSYSGYTLFWSDEFSANTLDPDTWIYEIGNGLNGWGNQELESYTNSTKNAFLSNGNLVIEARKEAVGGFEYSSARITTQNKKTFKYGRIDIRAKLPVGKGLWPALWMLGSNIITVGWPACGEIDIMELVGANPNTVVGSLHWSNITGGHSSKNNSYYLETEDFSQKFHVFSLIWGKDSLQWLIDDKLFFSVNVNSINPFPSAFNNSQFFIFNVAVGGLWPGTPPSTTIFPQRMFVDYVRVFTEI